MISFSVGKLKRTPVLENLNVATMPIGFHQRFSLTKVLKIIDVVSSAAETRRKIPGNPSKLNYNENYGNTGYGV